MKHNEYLQVIQSLDIDKYRKAAICPDLEMRRSNNVVVEYAPFDYIQNSAELVIVGLTPGRTQAANAIKSFVSSRAQGASVGSALETAKLAASFNGPMRKNLLAILDEIMLPQLFARKSASDFFNGKDKLTHFTSALRYPVYLTDGRNYSGSPDPLTHPVLLQMIETYLVEEIDALPKALWIPIGSHALSALCHLANLGKIDRERVLVGLPHPSGANAERIAYFLGRKSKSTLSAKTNAIKIDDAKAALIRQVASLKSKNC